MKINDYKRGLTTDEYAKVLNDCIGKVEGLNDLDWDEIVTKHNLGIHRDVLRKAFQSPMGGYSVYKYLQEEQINNVEKSNSMLDEVREAIGELDIKKQEVKNKTNQLNKIKRDFVKTIEIANDIKDCLMKYTEIPSIEGDRIGLHNDNKLIVQCGDWHIGYVIKGYKGNYYNYEIAKKRLGKLKEEIRYTCKLYDINKIILVHCGDHIENMYMRQNQSYECEFNLSQQIPIASKLLFSFANELSQLDEGKDVDILSVGGNHNRMTSNKDANVEGDNANVIITQNIKDYIELSKNNRLKVIDTDFLDDSGEFEVNGMNVKVIHGDNRIRDKKKMFDSESTIENTKYDLYLRGHDHNFNISSQNNGGYVVTCGSLFGFNPYSVKKMSCNTNASQTLIVVGKNNIEMIKDVNLQII